MRWKKNVGMQDAKGKNEVRPMLIFCQNCYGGSYFIEILKAPNKEWLYLDVQLKKLL